MQLASPDSENHGRAITALRGILLEESFWADLPCISQALTEYSEDLISHPPYHVHAGLSLLRKCCEDPVFPLPVRQACQKALDDNSQFYGTLPIYFDSVIVAGTPYNGGYYGIKNLVLYFHAPSDYGRTPDDSSTRAIKRQQLTRLDEINAEWSSARTRIARRDVEGRFFVPCDDFPRWLTSRLDETRVTIIATDDTVHYNSTAQEDTTGVSFQSTVLRVQAGRASVSVAIPLKARFLTPPAVTQIDLDTDSLIRALSGSDTTFYRSDDGSFLVLENDSVHTLTLQSSPQRNDSLAAAGRAHPSRGGHILGLLGVAIPLFAFLAAIL